VLSVQYLRPLPAGPGKSLTGVVTTFLPCWPRDVNGLWSRVLTTLKSPAGNFIVTGPRGQAGESPAPNEMFKRDASSRIQGSRWNLKKEAATARKKTGKGSSPASVRLSVLLPSFSTAKISGREKSERGVEGKTICPRTGKSNLPGFHRRPAGQANGSRLPKTEHKDCVTKQRHRNWPPAYWRHHHRTRIVHRTRSTMKRKTEVKKSGNGLGSKANSAWKRNCRTEGTGLTKNLTSASTGEGHLLPATPPLRDH